MLWTILLVSATCALLLTLLALLTGDLRLALLFPWRVSAWVVPVSTLILVGAVLDRWFAAQPRNRNLALGVASGCLLLAAALGTLHHFQIWHGEAPETALVAAIRARTAADDVLVVPPDLEWMRLQGERAIIADVKSHPFAADEVVAWAARLQLLVAVYGPERRLQTRIEALARVCDLAPRASWLLLPAGDALVSAAKRPVVWSDAHWALLSL